MDRWQERLFFLSNAIAGSWLRWVASILSILLVTGAVYVLWFGSRMVVKNFGAAVAAIHDPATDHPMQRAGELSGGLFKQLVANRWLAFDRGSARLDLRADCNALDLGFPAYDQRPAAPRGDSDKDEGAASLAAARRLCRSDPGTTIREEVDLWNQKTAVVAARDDRQVQPYCKDNPNAERCRADAWHADFALAPTGMAAAAALAGEPPFEVIAFMGLIQHEGFGPWFRFDGSMALEGGLVLRTTVPANAARDGKITVDVIGDLVTAEWRYAAQAARDPAAAATPANDVDMMCAKPETRRSCKELLATPRLRHMARGYRVTFEFNGARAVELRLVVKPAPAVERRIAFLEQARFRVPEPGESIDDDSDRTISLTDQIVARCNRIDPAVIGYGLDEDVELRIPAAAGNPQPRQADICMLDWIVRKPVPVNIRQPERLATPGTPGTPGATGAPVPVVEPGTLTVRLGVPEPVVLTNTASVADATIPGKTRTRVEASDAARSLALLPLVGVDDTDETSLIGQFRPRVPAGGNRELELTIDARLQRFAYEQLSGLMSRQQPVFNAINAFLPAEYRDARRGAIALIDGGALGANGYDEDAGRVLAAASWPQLGANVAPADWRSVMQRYPSRSPLAARAWAQNDRFNAPGSSLKPIVALAAIDRAARGDDTIANMLGAEPGRPGLDAAGIQNTFGNRYGYQFRTTALAVPVYPGSRRESTHSISTASGQLCSDAQGGCRADSRIRMHDMLVHSNNIYFARLALALDENAVSTAGADGKRVETTSADSESRSPLAIARMVTRLWPDQARAIFPGEQTTRFSRVQATPIQLDETRREGPRLLSVALNGIGQSAQATPLAMASMMASIATGRIVLPRLTPQDDARRDARGQPLLDPGGIDGRPLDQARANQMIDNLRRALGDVVRVGTASGAFSNSNLVGRLRGKTGTAQSDDVGGPDTVWFIGWLDGLALPGLEGRRIAFACMLTHADPEDSAGGKTCAPFMRMLFERIERSAAPPAAAPKKSVR
jgi:cell division protein FtsI/penicillin-binding protein 2